MRIISYNVNGIRAAIKRGFLDWLKTNPADVICLQEIKADENVIDKVSIEAAGYPYQQPAKRTIWHYVFTNAQRQWWVYGFV